MISNEDVGRFVITTESLRAGEVIMESEPYSLVVNEEYIPFVCHNCFMTKLMHDADDKEVQPFSCSACDSVRDSCWSNAMKNSYLVMNLGLLLFRTV